VNKQKFHIQLHRSQERNKTTNVIINSSINPTITVHSVVQTLYAANNFRQQKHIVLISSLSLVHIQTDSTDRNTVLSCFTSRVILQHSQSKVKDNYANLTL